MQGPYGAPAAPVVGYGAASGTGSSGGAQGAPSGTPSADRNVFLRVQRHLETSDRSASELFRRFDKLGRADNKLSTKELERLMELVEPTITDRELRHFMLMVDIDGTGEISLEEFSRAVGGAVLAEAGVQREVDVSVAQDADVVRVEDIMRRLRDNMQRTGRSVKDVFEQFDEDGSGQLEHLELVKLFKHCCPGLNQLELQYLIQHVHELDTDGDGMVSLEELRQYIRLQKAGVSVPPSPVGGAGPSVGAKPSARSLAAPSSSPQPSPGSFIGQQPPPSGLSSPGLVSQAGSFTAAAAAQQQQQALLQQQAQMQQAQAAAQIQAQQQAQVAQQQQVQVQQQQQAALLQRQASLQAQQQQLAAMRAQQQQSFTGGAPGMPLLPSSPSMSAAVPSPQLPPPAAPASIAAADKPQKGLVKSKPSDRNIFALVHKYMEKHGVSVGELFKRFDKGGVPNDGQLSMTEVERMMEAIEPTISDRELRFFLVMVDVNGDGQISSSEFSAALKSSKGITDKLRAPDALATGDEDVVRVSDIMLRLAAFVTRDNTTAHAVFNQFDKDGNGKLDAGELRNLFAELLPSLSDDEMRYLLANMAEVDLDGDGSLSLQELREYFEKVGAVGAGIASEFADADKAAAERQRRGESPEELLRLAKEKVAKAAKENVFKRARAWLKAEMLVSKDDFFLLRTFDINQDGSLGQEEIGALGAKAVPDISAAQKAYFMAMVDVEGAYVAGVQSVARAGTAGYGLGRPPPTGAKSPGMTQRAVMEALRACSELHRKVHDQALTVQEDEDLAAGEASLASLAQTLEQFRGVLKRAFDHYDADKDGLCDFSQMAAVYRSLRPRCTRRELRLWLVRMAACDTLNRGQVDYATVKALITARAPLLGSQRQPQAAPGAAAPRLPPLAPLGALPPVLPPGLLGGAGAVGVRAPLPPGMAPGMAPFLPPVPPPFLPAALSAQPLEGAQGAAIEERRVLPPLGEPPKGTPQVTADDAPPGGWTRLMVLSSRVPRGEVPTHALRAEVGVLVYDYDATTPAGLMHAIRCKLNDSPVASLALVTHSKAACLSLVKGFRSDLDTLRATPGVRDFWRDLALLVAPGGRIDLLGCSVAAGDGMKLIARLEGLTGIDFAASDDISHEAGDFFLETDNIDAATVYFEEEPYAAWYRSLANKCDPGDSFGVARAGMQAQVQAELQRAMASGAVRLQERPPPISVPPRVDDGSSSDDLDDFAGMAGGSGGGGGLAAAPVAAPVNVPVPEIDSDADSSDMDDGSGAATQSPLDAAAQSPQPKGSCCGVGRRRNRVRDAPPAPVAAPPMPPLPPMLPPAADDATPAQPEEPRRRAWSFGRRRRAAAEAAG